MTLVPPAIRTIIVDDETPARDRLQALMRDRPDVELIGAATNGLQAVELILERQPQLLFLDIQMPLLDGFGVLRQVPQAQRPVTVFVTAYDRYAVAAFDAQAVDYLLKPFSDERFEAALAHALASIRARTAADRQLDLEGVLAERSALNPGSGHLERIVIRMNGRVVPVALEDIDWIGAAGVYVEIHIGTTFHLYRSSLSTLLGRLGAHRFVRVHRSAAVNTDRIVELRPKGHGDYTVVMRGGREITMSRGYRTHLAGWLGQPL